MKVAPVQDLIATQRISTVVGDMCMYGMTTPISHRSATVPAKTPTQFMSIGWYFFNALPTR